MGPREPAGREPASAATAAGIAQDAGRNAAAVQENGDPPRRVRQRSRRRALDQETPLMTSNLRAPGNIANVFAVEGFTDEIAAAVAADSSAFRLKSADRPARHRGVERGPPWCSAGGRAPPPTATQAGPADGRSGDCTVRYKQTENYAGMAMEVAVDRRAARSPVRRVTCAFDCGLVANPDALKNQVEGAIGGMLSCALHEEVTFDASLESRALTGRAIRLQVSRSAGDLRHPDSSARSAASGRWRGGTVPVAAALGTRSSMRPGSGCAGRRSPPIAKGCARARRTDGRQLPKMPTPPPSRV